MACGRELQRLDGFRRITSGPSRGRFGIRRTCKLCERLERRARERRKREAETREQERRLATRIRQSSVREFARLLTEDVLCRALLDSDKGAERLLRSISFRVLRERLRFEVPSPVLAQIAARRHAKTMDADQLRQLVATLASEIQEGKSMADILRPVEPQQLECSVTDANPKREHRDDEDQWGDDDARADEPPSPIATDNRRPGRKWTYGAERRRKQLAEYDYDDPTGGTSDCQDDHRTVEDLERERIRAIPPPPYTGVGDATEEALAWERGILARFAAEDELAACGIQRRDIDDE